MEPEILQKLLESVAAGDISPIAALDKLKHFDFEQVGDFAKIDHHRTLRTGFPEVIWRRGKHLTKLLRLSRRCAGEILR